RFNTSAGNHVKEILLKLNLPDHRILKDGGEDQERYENVGPKLTSTQDGTVYKMAKRDYAWLMISRSSRSHSCQIKDTSQSLKSMITTPYSQDNVEEHSIYHSLEEEAIDVGCLLTEPQCDQLLVNNVSSTIPQRLYQRGLYTFRGWRSMHHMAVS
nr:putative homeodomain-like protein [Tanacetum cinerariifolium]